MSTLRDALRELSEDVFFDLLESEDAYLLVLDVPGVTADSLDLSIEDGRLSIDAKREKDLSDDYRYLEENRSVFLDLSVPLPDDALAEETDVSVDRGVLEVTVPKRSTDGETTIDVVDRSSSGRDDREGAGDGRPADDEERTEPR
ncbi:Hsp20/alpha crystallin family protein [Natrarchaeobius oligotrophus]|uniref:Hsp20/alpha crystallin family protein n=1 Tax=Natrarchaeobius chitinivorans TaxID=1679083 RepID=A0A3N6MZF5_NATCH|nr:Hsp20/alpha crystallin family protein [Natrarchaeobius chitinivorans]RQH03541.1 Hsp20/alpha crystallin family protein [Natrarchaeobius chitinivorans]